MNMNTIRHLAYHTFHIWPALRATAAAAAKEVIAAVLKPCSAVAENRSLSSSL
jgi:hypothetical protein